MRTYADACGITRGLDVIGDRWAVPIVRELLFGPRRYTDLAAALPGVSTNMLGTRLAELTAAGVLDRRRLPAPAAATVYSLTAWGAQLEPVLLALGRWAAPIPADLATQHFSAVSFALSLRSTFDPAAADGVTVTVRVETGSEVFVARIADAALTVARAEPDQIYAPAAARAPADSGASAVSGDDGGPGECGGRVVLVASPAVLAALVHQSADPEVLATSGALEVHGSAAALAAFTRCFCAPGPVGDAAEPARDEK